MEPGRDPETWRNSEEEFWSRRGRAASNRRGVFWALLAVLAFALLQLFGSPFR